MHVVDAIKSTAQTVNELLLMPEITLEYSAELAEAEQKLEKMCKKILESLIIPYDEARLDQFMQIMLKTTADLRTHERKRDANISDDVVWQAELESLLRRLLGRLLLEGSLV